MHLLHIPLDQLTISPCNMRSGKRKTDISDILPSVRRRGIIQTLLVRPNGEGYEIVAGTRRFLAAKAVAEEVGAIEPLPCAVMEPGDDADAIEASLIENAARLDPDEMTQHETFVRLVNEGRSVADIADTFGVTELMVKRRLALGNLVPRIREAYRRDEIDAETARHLTLASVAQQRAWLKLRDGEEYAPTGHQLKQWLFGGESIPTAAALFPLEEYGGEVVADLFGDQSYFADANLFWQKQNAAIAKKRDAFLAAGWADAVVLEPGEGFSWWEHEKATKKQGGKVYIAVSHRGDVTVHHGFLPKKQVRALNAAREAEGEKADRPEMTRAMQNYVDLHRHAAVRAALLKHPKTALRLMIAHAVAGSRLWRVEADREETVGEAIAGSLSASEAHAAFLAERRAILELLGMSEDAASVTNPSHQDVATVFARLNALDDKEVSRVAAFVMAETLAAGSAAVEDAGTFLDVDMTRSWTPDDAFFGLLRTKAVINPMLAEVAGESIANARLTDKAATQKQVLRDCLLGENGRKKAAPWAPRWMRFPSGGYGDAAQNPGERMTV